MYLSELKLIRLPVLHGKCRAVPLSAPPQPLDNSQQALKNRRSTPVESNMSVQQCRRLNPNHPVNPAQPSQPHAEMKAHRKQQSKNVDNQLENQHGITPDLLFKATTN